MNTAIATELMDLIFWPSESCLFLFETYIMYDGGSFVFTPEAVCFEWQQGWLSVVLWGDYQDSSPR